MRLQEHIRHNDLALQLGVLAFVPRVLVGAHVVPRPAVEAVFFHRGDIVRNEVVAQAVTLVGGAPELAGGGMDGLADAVADAGGVDLQELALGGELEDVRAVELLGVVVDVVYV